MNKQETIQRARGLGFKIEDREWLTSDYALKTNPDTFEEREVWSTTKQRGYWLTFPPDYSYPSQLVFTTKDILGAIREYENRFEAMRENAKKSEDTKQAMDIMRMRLK